MVKGDDIQERLINFAVRIMKLCSALPRTYAGRHVGGQLLRSGTSPAPNYGEARGAESKPDFVHKLGIVLKELNESWTWLVIIQRSELLPAERVQPLLDESVELRKIISTSIHTAKRTINDKR